VWHARAMRIIALILLVTGLIPCVIVAGVPVPDQFGRVVDAATGSPVAGVRIVAIDSGSLLYGAEPRAVEVVSDSLGKYALSLWGQSWVAYSAPHYESIRLVYPGDLVECDSCCGRLKDVRLKPRRRGL
jgi:hypothetical protein